jgi:mannan endo-1,4-beta-mannosidase
VRKGGQGLCPQSTKLGTTLGGDPPDPRDLMAVQGASPWRGSRGQSPLVFLFLLAPLLHPPAAHAQGYATMASAPDPTDFVKHTDTGLTLLGTPLRFGGADVSWLGLRRDGGAVRRPTAYEVKDALLSVQALGGAVVRSATLAGTAGCALCLEPAAGKFSDDGFAALDLAIKTASDLGLKLILPLAGSADCAGDPSSAVCAYAGWQGGGDVGRFFGDAAIRAAFIARVKTILDHVNTLTGIVYHDDPTILAWENCDDCGVQADPAVVAVWVEAVGQAVKAEDHLHPYENGAFAGRILPRSAHPVRAADFATPSVDIVGDRHLPPGDTAAIRATLAEAASTVTDSGRVYVLDSFDWGPGTWTTQDSFAAFLDAITRRRTVTGALVGGLQGHADAGGYLPVPPARADGASPLYFPGVTIPGIDRDVMEQRARALRHFDYRMSDVLLPPAFLLPPKPEIIAAHAGRVSWRGAAGARDYSIERSPDPRLPETWQMLCDECTTDAGGPWQDAAPSKDPAWYRVMPFNINGHKAQPSEPVANH